MNSLILLGTIFYNLLDYNNNDKTFIQSQILLQMFYGNIYINHCRVE